MKDTAGLDCKGMLSHVRLAGRVNMQNLIFFHHSWAVEFKLNRTNLGLIEISQRNRVCWPSIPGVPDYQERPLISKEPS